MQKRRRRERRKIVKRRRKRNKKRRKKEEKNNFYKNNWRGRDRGKWRGRGGKNIINNYDEIGVMHVMLKKYMETSNKKFSIKIG